MSVYVCVSVSGLGFYYPETPNSAPVGIDNPKKKGSPGSPLSCFLLEKCLFLGLSVQVKGEDGLYS